MPDAVKDFTQRFDHLDPDLMADPYPVYRELREQCPVVHSDAHEDRGFFVLSRYEDVTAAAAKPNVFCSGQRASIPALGMPPLIPIEIDPPDHLKYRTLLSPAFSPGRVAQLETLMREETDRLIDAFIDRGQCDLVAELARPLPMRILALILDLPLEDMPSFSGWIDAMVFRMHVDPTAGLLATGELFGYLNELIGQRAAAPGDDLIGMMLTAELDGERLTHDEILNVLVLLVFAGLDTTAIAISGAVDLLDRDPACRQRLFDDPSLLPQACDELLRLVSPAQSMARTVTEAVSIGGHDFAPGDRVLLLFASANRDEQEFDSADSLIPDRPSNRHLAFGSGIHRCLGSHLGRLEMRVVLERVLARMPNFSVSDRSGVDWTVGHIRGMRTLPITF